MTALIAILVIIFPNSIFAQEYPEIHCKHFFFGYPTGTPSTNDLIIRDIYALSSNDETKLADWVAYRLDNKTISGDSKPERKWEFDPWLDSNETLEPEDYKGISNLGMDRGHQAPLASFKGTKYAVETNYLSNITPQKSDLNQGAWVNIENKERKLVKVGYVIYVMTGPLYERDMPQLPNADEPYKTPSGYWKIILTKTGVAFDSIMAASFIFDQDTKRKEKVLDHLTT
ncbi:MAG: DNA/RNA non-specific endonuclease, partial [Thermodesulfobacteriota bacterium]